MVVNLRRARKAQRQEALRTIAEAMFKCLLAACGIVAFAYFVMFV